AVHARAEHDLDDFRPLAEHDHFERLAVLRLDLDLLVHQCTVPPPELGGTGTVVVDCVSFPNSAWCRKRVSRCARSAGGIAIDTQPCARCLICMMVFSPARNTDHE